MRANPKLPVRLRVYVACVVIAGTAAIGHSLLSLHEQGSGTAWLILAALTLFSGSFTVKVPSIPARISVSETFVFTAVLLFGTAPGTLIVALDGLIISMTRRNRRLHRVLFNSAEPALSIWLASWIFSALAGPNASVSGAMSIGSLILPLFALAAAYFALNSWLTAFAVSCETGTPALTVWRQHFLWLSLNYFGGASVAILLARNAPGLDVGAVNVVLPALSIILPLLVISYLTFKTAMGRVQDATEHVSQLNSLYLSTLETLAMAIDAKDQITHGHIRRVQTWAVHLARELGIRDDALIQAIEAAALLHDIGKIGVPEHILNKPGKLTPAEFERMKLHASIGADLVATIHFRDLVVPIVRHHHENWNGTGYPDGLAGTNIPIGGRILAVVDCFDALTSDRPYRQRLGDDEAVNILVERRGIMYDPLIVDAFLRVRRELSGAAIETRADRPAVSRLAQLAMTPVEPSTALAPHKTDLAATTTQILELYEMASGLAGKVSLADATAIVWRHLRRVIPADTCVFFLYEHAVDRLTAVHAYGAGENLVTGFQLKQGSGVTGWVAVNRQTMLNADATLDLGERATATSPVLVSCLSTPLVTDGDLIGALSLYSSVPLAFAEDHRRVIEMVSRQISRTVKDAAAFDKSHASSLRDSLTGLPDLSRLSHFVDSGDATGGRGATSVAIVLLNVQDFSAIKRRYGHPLADLVLGHVAIVLRNTLRGADILFKSENHEFVLLLTQTDTGTAQGIVNRMLESVRQDPFILEDGCVLPVRVAVGMAVQPQDGRTWQELVSTARQRMGACAGSPLSATTAIH